MLGEKWRCERGDFSDRHRFDMLAVEPIQFFLVEDRARLLNAVDVEFRDQFLARQHFLIAAADASRATLKS